MYNKCILALVFCAAFAYVQCDEDLSKERTSAVANECKETVGANDADIEALLKHELSETKEAKCLRACVMKKFQLMSDDGKLNHEVAMKFTKSLAKGDADKEAIGTEIVETCAALEVPEDHCEAAAEYESCIKHHADEKGFPLSQD